MTEQSTLPATQAVRAEVEPWPERAKALVVNDDASYQVGAALLGDIKGLRRKVDQTLDPIIEAAHRTHKQALASKKEVEAPLVLAENTIKSAMAAHVERVEAERRRVEREAQEAARKAEQERLAAEAAARKAAEVAARENARPATQAKVDIAAEEARVRAEQAQAEAQRRLDAAVAAAPKPAASGAAAATTWSAQVVDMGALIEFIAVNPQYRNLVLPNETALNALARAQKEGFNMPGVRAVSKVNIRTTA